MKWQSVALSAIVAVLASAAIALAGPIGPSVDSGSSPLRSFALEKDSTKTVYTVPKGAVLVLTDLVVSKRGSENSKTTHGCVRIDGVRRMCGDVFQVYSPSQHIQLTSGLRLVAGQKLDLQLIGQGIITVSGYLARP